MRPSNTTNPSDEKPFVRRREFIENQKMQIALAPVTLHYLKSFGLSDDRELGVDFFFYSRTQANADALAGELKRLNYEVETKRLPHEDRFSIVGCTPKMKMDEETFQHWVESMSDLGYKFDCNFDGWGTLLDLDPEDADPDLFLRRLEFNDIDELDET